MENNYRGNMTIPKKLKEKRDGLTSQPPWKIEGYVDFSYEFKSGFNAACNLLLPEIKKLELEPNHTTRGIK